MKHVTIKDIATELRLSVSTVSRALSGDKNIRQETKDLVAATAERMGYRRNVVAATLRTGRTNTIGVIVNEMITPFCSRVLDGIQEVLNDRGMHLAFANSHNDPAKERQNLDLMEKSLVDGIIIIMCPSTANNEKLRRLAAKGLPIVYACTTPMDMDVNTVSLDHKKLGFALTEHLISLGRRRIVHLQGPQNLANFRDITEGFKAAVAHYNLNPEECRIYDTRLTLEDGERIARALVEDEVPFDAAFCSFDIMAVGMMNTLRHLGLRVPQDVAVAGFSGTNLAELVYPPLTTAQPPLEDIGYESATLLLNEIEKKSSTPREITLDAELCIRASTK